jgi:solute carrier family 25 carnitine/acylcarnitine transporter 20/29
MRNDEGAVKNRSRCCTSHLSDTNTSSALPVDTIGSGAAWATAGPLLSEELVTSTFAWVGIPEYTEHPKKLPIRKPTIPIQPFQAAGNEAGDVTFLQDFIAGGLAGSCSVIVGHPLDTMKVRVQNSTTNADLMSTIKEFGGVKSLFRGMGAPLGTAAVINALVFSSYGVGSTFYDKYIVDPAYYEYHTANHDPWQKAATCGMFAGVVQCLVICPMEHVKCRLQVQSEKGPGYKGPVSAARHIISQHGVTRFYQGWWATFWREVPAFGMYFAVYDRVKDWTNKMLAIRAGIDPDAPPTIADSHTWLASMLAGGTAGSITWAMVYPVDVIKTYIQTRPLDTPRSQLTIATVGRGIVARHGWRHLFRGLSITLVRAFPVNGTIFPVYEFTLMTLDKWSNP